MPRLSRILVYPIKSLDGVAVESAQVLPSGALEHDRQLALRDADGRYVNGKRTALVHALRSNVDWQARTVALKTAGSESRHLFHLDFERECLEAWLSELFQTPLHVVENAAAGFPDDTEAPGPTVVSTATLEVVASWFPDVSLDEVRLRFRANLEIGGVQPFWEDRLVGPTGQGVRFRIGNVLFDGLNPCQRCVVPTRSPASGEPTARFVQLFSERRRQALPAWAEASRFDHFYRLAVNTQSPSRGGELRLGDEVKILAADDRS